MSVLEALVRQYERLYASGEAPPYGYSRERITCALVLSHAGEPVAVLPLSEAYAQSPARRLCEVPHPVRRTSKPSAKFLWDKTAYVFGVKRHPVTRRPCPANGEHDAFRELHEGLLSGVADEGLQALLCFLRVWDPNDYDALPHAEAMLGSNVIFRLEGERDWLRDRPEAKLAWAEHLARTVPAHGTCLITGARAPIALVHPAVKEVRGTHAAGAALVTFNLNTFESYGKTQGANAPISIQVAFAYTTALNALLAPGEPSADPHRRDDHHFLGGHHRRRDTHGAARGQAETALGLRLPFVSGCHRPRPHPDPLRPSHPEGRGGSVLLRPLVWFLSALDR